MVRQAYPLESTPFPPRDALARERQGRAAGVEAWATATRGELGRAEVLADAILGDAEATAEARAGARLAQAAVAWGRDRPVEARLRLDQALGLAERTGHMALTTLVRLEQALLASGIGDHVEAIGLVVDVEHELIEGRSTAILQTVFDEVDAAVHLAAGDLDRAEALVQRLPAGAPRALLAARISLERGRVERVLAEVGGLLEDDDLDRRHRIEALLLASRAEEARGDDHTARCLRSAVAALTQADGHVRVYLDHGLEPPST